MALTPDRQGYLGNVESKTLPQLQELLERQEQILTDRNLLKILPDKGEKVQRFSENLKHLIKQRTSESQIHLEALHKNSAKPLPLDESDQDVKTIDSNVNQTIEALLSRNEENTIITQHGDDTPDHGKPSPPTDDLSELSSHLQEFHLGTRSRETPTFSNSYENVIKKAAVNQHPAKPKYLPNRTLKCPLEDSPSLHRDLTKKKKNKVVEESAVHPPEYAHQSVKLISIEESVSLIEEQRKRNENLVAERAAQRLAERLVPKMATYSPSQPDMQYRESKTDAGQAYDSDDVPSDADDVLEDVD